MPESIVPQACWCGKWEMAQHNRDWFLSIHISQNEEVSLLLILSFSLNLCFTLPCMSGLQRISCVPCVLQNAKASYDFSSNDPYPYPRYTDDWFNR